MSMLISLSLDDVIKAATKFRFPCYEKMVEILLESTVPCKWSTIECLRDIHLFSNFVYAQRKMEKSNFGFNFFKQLDVFAKYVSFSWMQY